MGCKDKELRLAKDDIKDKDRSYDSHNSLIQDLWDTWWKDYELATIDKENEDWFFKSPCFIDSRSMRCKDKD